MKITLTPFDPDSLAPARGWTADVVIDEVAELPPGMMLSDLLKGAPAEAAPEQGPGTAAPLDKRRKWILSELAERAYKAAKPLTPGESLKDYRGRIATAACGRRISLASVGDYKVIQAAFLHELGAAQAAARAAAQATGTARDIALWNLGKALKKHGKSEGYAEGIAARIYKRPIAALGGKEVWTVIYTINNNANAAAGKGNADNRFKSLKAKRAANKYQNQNT